MQRVLPLCQARVCPGQKQALPLKMESEHSGGPGVCVMQQSIASRAEATAAVLPRGKAQRSILQTQPRSIFQTQPLDAPQWVRGRLVTYDRRGGWVGADLNRHSLLQASPWRGTVRGWEGSWSWPWAAWRGAEVSQGTVTKRGPRDLPPTGHMGDFQLRGCAAVTVGPRGTVTLSVPRGPSPLRLPRRICSNRDIQGTSQCSGHPGEPPSPDLS